MIIWQKTEPHSLGEMWTLHGFLIHETGRHATFWQKIPKNYHNISFTAFQTHWGCVQHNVQGMVIVVLLPIYRSLKFIACYLCASSTKYYFIDVKAK